MKKYQILLLAAIFALVLISASSVHPQLSIDEQDAIVEAVVKTLNPDNMKAQIAAQIEADLIAKFNAAGFVGIAGALSVPLEGQSQPVTVIAAEPTATPAASSGQAGTVPTAASGTSAETASAVPAQGSIVPTPTRQWDDIKNFYDGAIQQEDGTWRGLHAKQVNSYAYAVGEDEDGVVRQFRTEFQPNKSFNLDVVFENDGSVVWPARVEMRMIGSVGEYTGHATSVVVDRTFDPVKPGDKAAFTVSAYGSENLGWITFYFQLYDADSGSVIEGGYGSFTYHAVA